MSDKPTRSESLSPPTGEIVVTEGGESQSRCPPGEGSPSSPSPHVVDLEQAVTMSADAAEIEAWRAFKIHELECHVCMIRARRATGNCTEGAQLRQTWARVVAKVRDLLDTQERDHHARIAGELSAYIEAERKFSEENGEA